MRTVLLLVLMMLMAVGCSTESPAEQSEIESVQEQPVEEVVKQMDLYGWDGVASLEEMIAASDIIVRARFVSAVAVGVRSLGAAEVDANGVYQFDGYHGSLELAFNVLEYLKGSGGDQVKGIAYGSLEENVRADTAEQAAQLAQPLLNSRDDRWDSREAIVFLRTPQGLHLYPHLSQQMDYYWMGEIGSSKQSDRQVNVASGEGRAWLPKKVSDPGGGSQTRTVSKEQFFLLEDPAAADSSGARSASGSSSSPEATTASISLTNLKAKISTQETAAAASSDPEAYRDCLADTYWLSRLAEGQTYQALTSSVESGMAAGSTVYTYRHAVESNLWEYGATEPANSTEVWYTGRDAGLLDEVYPGYLTVVRPLPSGEYRAFLLWRDQRMVICDGYPEVLRDKLEHIITVKPPDGTLAEAFYDPVTDGDAVTATTTVGTISWETDEVEAALTVAGTTGHVLDFIELDGSVSLSLAIDDATDTDGTLSWPVATQPWENGDQLMLRVRRVPITVTLTPRGTGNLAYTDITVEWTDPGTCDSRYLVGVYTQEDAIVRNLGFHPAPATTSVSPETNYRWSQIPELDFYVQVACAPTDGSVWRKIGEVTLQSGLPSGSG